MNDIERRNRFMDEARKAELREKAKKKAVQNAKRKTKRKAKKTAKKISAVSYVIWAIALIAGIALGAVSCMFICRNDGFRLNGKSEYTLTVGQENNVYKDKGAQVISFGRDVSENIKVSTDLLETDDGEYKIDTSKEGVYYIIYTIDDARFGEIKRVRTFRVVSGEMEAEE